MRTEDPFIELRRLAAAVADAHAAVTAAIAARDAEVRRLHLLGLYRAGKIQSEANIAARSQYAAIVKVDK